MTEELKPYFNLRSLKIGQEVLANILHSTNQNKPKKLQSLRIKTSLTTELVLKRHLLRHFTVSENMIPLEIRIDYAEGFVENNLYATARHLGLPSEATARIFHAFSYDVDFERDIQEGQSFQVLFERYYHLNGEFSHVGKILYASLGLSQYNLEIFHHKLNNGDVDYFTSDGSSVRKSLMKTPIPSARISSSYGMRMHPISNYNKLHKGVDFRAPTGTPIMAAGDGVITFKGVKGGYGNYLIVRHRNGLSTAYAHIHRYASKIKNGARVRQGEVIAYVGATGRATGPHLHYEVIVDGKRINPMGFKTTPGKKLAMNELTTFMNRKQKVYNILDTFRNAKISQKLGSKFSKNKTASLLLIN